MQGGLCGGWGRSALERVSPDLPGTLRPCLTLCREWPSRSPCAVWRAVCQVHPANRVTRPLLSRVVTWAVSCQARKVLSVGVREVRRAGWGVSCKRLENRRALGRLEGGVGIIREPWEAISGQQRPDGLRLWSNKLPGEGRLQRRREGQGDAVTAPSPGEGPAVRERRPPSPLHR